MPELETELTTIEVSTRDRHTITDVEIRNSDNSDIFAVDVRGYVTGEYGKMRYLATVEWGRPEVSEDKTYRMDKFSPASRSPDRPPRWTMTERWRPRHTPADDPEAFVKEVVETVAFTEWLAAYENRMPTTSPR